MTRSSCSPSARRRSSPGSPSRRRTGRTSCGCASGLTAYRSRSSSPPSGCARCRSPELASQLESGIRMLTVSRRGTSPRHQTLRAAVEWSYQLCTPGRADAVGAAVGVRRDVRRERRRVGVRGRRAAARAGRPRAGRPRRQVRGPAGHARTRPGTGCSARCASSARTGSPTRAGRSGSLTGSPPARVAMARDFDERFRGSAAPLAAGPTARDRRAIRRRPSARCTGSTRTSARRSATRSARGAAAGPPAAVRGAVAARRGPRRAAVLLLADLRAARRGQAVAGQGGRPVPRAGAGTRLGARGPRPPGHLPGRPGPARSPTSASPSGWPRPPDAARNSPPPAVTCT